MKEEIFNKVAELISESNRLPKENITMNSTFEELDMDSLDGITLINDLENHYNIILSNEEAAGIKTVKEAVQTLESKIAQK